MKPRKSFWCRLGFHKWSACTRGYLRMSEGPMKGEIVGMISTWRCTREACHKEHDKVTVLELTDRDLK